MYAACRRVVPRAIDFRFFPDGIFDRQNEIFQLNRLTLAEIKDVIHWAIVIERGHRALNDIINVGVIAPRAAISKLIDRLPGVNAPGELMNRQIGPLPRTVNSEIPQRYDPHLVKVRVRRAKKFAGNFCRAIRTECLGQMLVLGKWDVFEAPYTDELEAKINRSTPVTRAASRRCNVR
jgi:hypothetical protein